MQGIEKDTVRYKQANSDSLNTETCCTYNVFIRALSCLYFTHLFITLLLNFCHKKQGNKVLINLDYNKCYVIFSFHGLPTRHIKNAEKDSIVFYLGMKDMVPAKLGKNRLDDIIKEEMEHIKIIGKKLSAFK